MTEDQHHPTSGHILGHLGSDHGSPEPGAGSNALALCHDRHASRSSAFHHSRRRVRPWSSSHIVTKHKTQANPLSSESMEPSPAEKAVWPSVHLETILVPTDLRPDSKVALSFALALAQKFEANLILLHVFSESYSSDAEVDAREARLLDITREDAERAVARLEQQLSDQHSKCRSAFRIGASTSYHK
jgi:hypothetical protein